MITYAFLREIQKKETESASLTKLPDDFYEGVSSFLKEKKDEALSSQSILIIKEYENIKKVVKTIQLRREEKLILLALRSQSAPDSLPRLETQLLDELSKLVSSYRQTVLDVWSSEVSQSSLKKIKIVREVERYKGLDNQVYGPFKAGDETLVPLQEAQWLLKSHLAESI